MMDLADRPVLAIDLTRSAVPSDEPGRTGNASGAGLVLGLDLGGTQIRAAAIAPDGSVRERTSRPTPVGAGVEAIVAGCVDQLRQVLAGLEATGSGRADVVGVGIAAPGPIDIAGGLIVDPPNLGPAFRDVPIVARVAGALDLPTVIDRDTQVAALGEGAFGAARGTADYLYLTVSTGIGGAVVSAGRLLHGPDGSAGELGHLVVDLDGPLCGCGAPGHLEAIASGSGIARAARAAIDAGEAPGLAARLGGGAFGAREVVAAADAGDPTARRIVDTAIDAFAAASVSLVDVFNPSLVVVGGSLGLGLGDRLLDPARAAVARLAFRRPAARARFVASALGDDVGLVGAQVLVVGPPASRAGQDPAERRLPVAAPGQDRGATVGADMTPTSRADP